MKNYIPDDTPKEILEYETNVKQLGVGKSGKVGILELELQGDITGKTIVTKQFSQVPLQIQRALYPERTISDMAYIYLISHMLICQQFRNHSYIILQISHTLVFPIKLPLGRLIF